jgi:hypothetical protein
MPEWATDTTASLSQTPQGQTQQGPSRFETLTLEQLVTLIEQGKEQSCDSFANGTLAEGQVLSAKPEAGHENDNEDDYTTPVTTASTSSKHNGHRP